MFQFYFLQNSKYFSALRKEQVGEVGGWRMKGTPSKERQVRVLFAINASLTYMAARDVILFADTLPKKKVGKYSPGRVPRECYSFSKNLK